jgi:hypothetical protein
MKQKALIVCSTTLCLFVILVSGSLRAAAKPDVTTHEATYMEGAVSMHVEWQSPNPVATVKITIANKEQEIKVDPYDNRRNREGYAGELNVTVRLDWVPSQPFNYIIQLEDDSRIRSSLARGKVRLLSSQQPAAATQPQQPSMQIQILQTVPQPGVQPNTTPGTQPSVQPDIIDDLSGSQPVTPAGIQPGSLVGTQPGALPGILPGVQPGNLQGGTLIVIIAPLIAAESGAMWRADGGSWMRNGEAIRNLSVGIHTVEFLDLGGWIKPENQKVMIQAGQTHTINGFYNSK